MEAEYIAASDVAKEALRLSRLMVMFRQSNLSWTLIVFNESQGAVALVRNPVDHNALKHIEVQYHFVRECVARKKVALK